MRAFAICANPVPGHHIERSPRTASSSTPRQSAEAVCPSGQRALGSGAYITNAYGGQLGLQVARASGTGDITRAQAHEDGDFRGSWRVQAFAVCAKAPIGYTVAYGESPQRHSESVKRADADCEGKRLIGAGAAVANTAPGNVALLAASPYSSQNKVWASAVENTPTTSNWDFMVAQAICAS